MNKNILMELYAAAFERFGPQNWWPGETELEIIVGTILTQNTNWSNVEKAILNLKSANCLSLQKLNELDIAALAELIRPAGYYNIKAKRLKNFIKYVFNHYGENLDEMERIDTNSLRTQLLSVNGIGPETADSILLYAFNKPVFVVDAYTYRILNRHSLISPDFDYEQTREFFQNHLPEDVGLFNEFHALLVRVGKEFCRPSPKCAGCPFESFPHQIEQRD